MDGHGLGGGSAARDARAGGHRPAASDARPAPHCVSVVCEPLASCAPPTPTPPTPPPPPLACLEVDDHEEDGHGGQQLHDVGQALAVESVLQGRGVGGGEGCKKGRGGGARGGGGGPPAGLMLQAGRAERPQGSQRKCEALAQARRCKQPSLP